MGIATRDIRFGAFIREVTVRQDFISYNQLTPQVSFDADGNELAHRPSRVRLRVRDIHRLVGPYVNTRVKEQLKAVVPLAVYLVAFQVFILRQEVADAWTLTGGLVAVIAGLTLFLEGLRVGLMPFGEAIGSTLPAKSPLPVVLLVTFLLGIGVTFAEPAIGALKTAGATVLVEEAPYLYALLNDWSGALVLLVGVGVGAAAVLGALRFLYGWKLKPIIGITLVPTLGLSAYLAMDPNLDKVLGLAWDCGAVTTGPVTVPLVLALGIGIAHAAGKGGSSLSGFGIVTLASLFPVLGVEALAIYVAETTSIEAIVAGSAQVAVVDADPQWYTRTPGAEIIAGLRAVVPLVLFLFVILSVVLRERLHDPGAITYGITLAVAGMVVFNVGLSYGLSRLGAQSGGLVPGAFTNVDAVTGSPLYTLGVGLTITVAFAWLLGFGATLAEPALNALGRTVEGLTNGAFPKSLLMYAVSVGVGCGITVGILKIVFSIPMLFLLVPGYALAALLTLLSDEEYVNVAWDSAGVTTGPVTVPLVLSMGLGVSGAVSATEGFGILAMASIGPIVAVLATGLWISWKVKRKHAAPMDELPLVQEVVT